MSRIRKKLYVFHTESIYPRGGEKYIFELFRRLSHTYHITIFFHKISKEWLHRYKKENITIDRLWRPKRFYWALIPLTLFVNFFRLRRFINKNDVVYATNFPLNALAVLLSNKTICHCFEPLSFFYDKTYISSLPLFSRFCVSIAKLLYSYFDKFAIRKATILVTLNNTVEHHIIVAYRRKADTFVPNGVDTVFFSPSASPLYKKEKKEFTIGHSTDYAIYKDTDTFLTSIALLQKKLHRLRVYITESILDQKEKKRYLSFLENHKLGRVIRFVGSLSEKNMPRFYNSLDVFCYTGSSKSAGGSTASLSALEAQACGIPVIRNTGNSEEIIDKITGFYTDANKPTAVARSLLDFHNLSPIVRRRISKQARKHVIKNFSWDTSARVLEKLILQLSTPT